MSVEVAKEPFSMELFSELLPLARSCWKESTENKGPGCAFHGERDFEIEPNTEQYQNMQNAGVLTVVTLRDENKLVGYMAAVIYYSLHHKKFLCANVDTIYIDPDYRWHTLMMVGFFEKDMTERGVAIIGWPTSQNGPIYEFLMAKGYTGDEIVMEKRLCVS